MAILLTGASGFIGSAVLKELVCRGEKVIGLRRRPFLGLAHPLVSWRIVESYTLADWDQLLEEVTAIYHFGWSSLPQTSNADPLGDLTDNLLGTLRLLESVKKRYAGLRFIFASSGGTVYGTPIKVPVSEAHPTRPSCAYGVSKLAVENYMALYRNLWDLDGVALRIGNPYGPGQNLGRNFGAIITFATRALQGEPITIYGDGSVIRDYIYISDLAEAIVDAGLSKTASPVINIGSGIGHSLTEIIDELQKQIDRPFHIVHMAARDFDVPVSILDISLAKAQLGWIPRTTLTEGLTKTLGFLREGR